MDDEILATVQASTPRRAFGVAVLAMLGLLLISLVFGQPSLNLGWQIFLLLLGAGAFWMAIGMWRATDGAIFLTKERLFTSGGTLIADVADIAAVDRGTFAFKPSHGFMLRLKAQSPRRWQPGLWWCLGRRVGIGGVTHAAQAKVMADTLSAMIAMRGRETPEGPGR